MIEGLLNRRAKELAILLHGERCSAKYCPARNNEPGDDLCCDHIDALSQDIIPRLRAFARDVAREASDQDTTVLRCSLCGAVNFRQCPPIQ